MLDIRVLGVQRGVETHDMSDMIPSFRTRGGQMPNDFSGYEHEGLQLPELSRGTSGQMSSQLPTPS